ncbi:hypothetical protein SFOMI_5070 [Sphingobium fuliginis]|uniref:Uncharacterized protein n=1 Tax=Sphingobium fuliginis (strain ATCC 27551) TaxID=336203 RepID=A0A292ZNM6_SPHSA|nr:hypothetical protein SFOMI_5070 [Sphingobium fuliginis]
MWTGMVRVKNGARLHQRRDEASAFMESRAISPYLRPSF